MTAAPLALALLLSAPADPAGEVRLAVVAGNNRGLDTEQRLDFAEQDARRMHAVLVQLGGVAPQHAALVLGGGPDELLRALEAMLGRALGLALAPAGRAQVTLLLYVSAHADEENLHLGGKLLPLERLRLLLEGAPAHLRISVVDGCRLPVKAVPKGGRPGPEVPVVVDRSSRVDGEVFISAASAGELAQEWSALRGSLFTHHLIAGLRGAADLDHDGRVTLNEAYAFAYRTTLARAAEAGLVPQHPSFDMRLAGIGDWVFTRVGAGGAEITLSEPLGGRFWFTDQRSDVLAEVDKQPGEPLRLSLEPGRYRVIKLGAERVEAIDVNLALGGSRRIEPGELLRVRAERALSKGGAALELHPWSLVAGWATSSASAAGMSLQQAAEAGVEHALGAWRLRAMVGAGWSTTAAQGATLHQTELRLPVSFARAFDVSLATLALGVEVRPRVVWQELVRQGDPGTLGVPIPDQWAFLAAVGPSLSATFPMGDRFTVGLEAWAGYEWGPDGQGDVAGRSVAQVSLIGGWKL